MGQIPAKGIMYHDWILEVLEDLRTYAVKNGLPATAAQAEEALRVAKAEVVADDGPLGARAFLGMTQRQN